MESGDKMFTVSLRKGVAGDVDGLGHMASTHVCVCPQLWVTVSAALQNLRLK